MGIHGGNRIIANQIYFLFCIRLIVCTAYLLVRSTTTRTTNYNCPYQNAINISNTTLDSFFIYDPSLSFHVYFLFYIDLMNCSPLWEMVVPALPCLTMVKSSS